MAILIIPTNPNGAYIFTQRTPLEGREYSFRFEWNDRAQGWFMSMGTEDDSPIILSRRLVVDHELLKGVTVPIRPPGALYLLEVHNGRNDPGRFDLGTNHLLHYQESTP